MKFQFNHPDCRPSQDCAGSVFGQSPELFSCVIFQSFFVAPAYTLFIFYFGHNMTNSGLS
jgi:hypothetical protein